MSGDDRRLYFFDAELEPADRVRLLGSKGAGLNALTRLGAPVPPGFTISCEVGASFLASKVWPSGLPGEVRKAVDALGQAMGRGFGDTKRPLLLSARSGAAASMPGMMDTVLNLGLTDKTLEGVAALHNNRRFALDAYRRLIQMYGSIVEGVPRQRFESALGVLKSQQGNPRMRDSELDEKALERLCEAYLRVLEEGGGTLPQDPHAQLRGAIEAVFRSWDSPRAQRYRNMQRLSDRGGTACTVQAMVFGNLGDDSGSGVAFTRNPSSGERILYGEYLPNAQGEDVVAGFRTPVALTAAASMPGREDHSLERASPEVFGKVQALCQQLETHFADMQEIEFTVEQGAPFILQTRAGKRSPEAAVRVAVELVQEGTIDRETALRRVQPDALEQLVRARLPETSVLPLAKGLPASPGAVSGHISLSAADTLRRAADGQPVLFVRRETIAEDIDSIKSAKGLLTAAGGMTSHAAVVARGLGKTCVVGCGSLTIDEASGTITLVGADGENTVLHEGDLLTLDGGRGTVYAGALDLIATPTVPQFDTFIGWADDVRRLRVRANADTPQSARAALGYGAEGIGLCRTEHMFFAPERVELIRCLALCRDDLQRKPWLEAIQAVQRDDFVRIFEAMPGMPVTIRLLDSPLREFLPRSEEDLQRIADAIKLPIADVRRDVRAMRQANPILGHRGVRLGITEPAVYQAQLQAIFQAACVCAERGIAVLPEIMIPFVGYAAELQAMADLVRAVRDEVCAARGCDQDYRFGTMVELPRACLLADQLAPWVDFISFGTNDLTQTALGMTAEDAGRFLSDYLHRGLAHEDPFVELDPAVIELISTAAKRARGVRPELEIGICGEHAGQARAVEHAERLGLSYVSCPPPRLPVARLAAARARLG